MTTSTVIIGGGPAGCQCALWLTMLGHKVILIEETSRLGGLQNTSPYINNWMIGTIGLQGKKIAQHIQKHIEKLAIPVYFNTTAKNITKTNKDFEINFCHPAHAFSAGSSAGQRKVENTIHTNYLVIATGVKPKKDYFISSENILIGPGEKIKKYPFFKKKVAILGGGDNAAENYSFIIKKYPAQCHLYVRTIRARKNLLDQVDKENIFTGNYQADQQSMAVTYQNQTQHYDVFVILYGWEANISSALEPFKKDLLDDQNFIMTDDFKRTKIPNILAIGEVARCLFPCVTTAMADGVIAAKTIQLELEK